jgi:hypothetical protein
VFTLLDEIKWERWEKQSAAKQKKQRAEKQSRKSENVGPNLCVRAIAPSHSSFVSYSEKKAVSMQNMMIMKICVLLRQFVDRWKRKNIHALSAFVAKQIVKKPMIRLHFTTFSI